MPNSKIAELEEKANYICRQILDMCVKAGTSHVTSSFLCTEIMVATNQSGNQIIFTGGDK